MTIEEKREKIRAYCIETWCDPNCPLYASVRDKGKRCWSYVKGGDHADIDKNYAILFGEDNSSRERVNAIAEHQRAKEVV